MVSQILHKPALVRRILMKGRGENKSVFIALIIGFCGVAGVFIATRTPGALSSLEPVLFFVAPVLVIVAVRNWERGIQIILVVVIVEGAVRKWFLPSATEIVYFYKDVVMAATLFGYFRKRRKEPFVIKRRVRLASIAIGLFAFYALTSIGMPSGPHPLIGLLGLKAYCLYIPLAFITPRAFPDKERLIGFLKWYSLIVLPVAVIGVMQFLDTNRGSSLNRYAIEQMPGQVTGIAMFGTASENYYVRITGTFSYVTGLSVYLPIMFALLLALTSLYSKRGLPRWSRILYYSALGVTVVLAFMTGSRGSVLAMVVVAIVFYLFTSGRQIGRRLQQIAVVGVIIFVALTSVFPQAYDAFYNRTFGGEGRRSEGWSRMTSVLNLPTNEASYAGLLGYGIGLTQNAVPALMRRLGISEADRLPVDSEGESGRVTLELGMIGFVLYTLMRLVLLVTVWRMSMSMRDRESKMLAFAATAALVVPLVAGGAITTHTLNVYQWFLVGIVFALYNAERVQLRKQIQPVAMPPLAAYQA
jgi:hypothetical protein